MIDEEDPPVYSEENNAIGRKEFKYSICILSIISFIFLTAFITNRIIEETNKDS